MLAVATGAAGIGVSVTSRYSGLQAVVNGDYSTGLQANVNGVSLVGARICSATTNSSDVALYADATQSGDAVVAYGRFTGVHASANADNGVGVFGSTFGAHGFGVFADAEGPATTAIPLFVESSISDTLIDTQTCQNATCTLTLDRNGYVVPSRLPSEESLLRKLPQPVLHSIHVAAAQRAQSPVVRKP